MENLYNDIKTVIENNNYIVNDIISKKITILCNHIIKKTKYKKKPIPKAVKTAVWNKYIGEKYGTSKCFTGCKSTISCNNHECGHIIAEVNGGEINIDNLRPICSCCNKSMGSQNMNEFIKKHGLKSKKCWLF